MEVIFDSSSVQGIINNKALWPTLVLWKKPKCEKLGVCKFKMKNATDDHSLIGREVDVPIIYDSVSNSFSKIKLEFTSSPSFLNSNDIRFYIIGDFDLDVTPEMNLPFNIIRISSGIIEYDSTLGSFGGYEFDFVGVY